MDTLNLEATGQLTLHFMTYFAQRDESTEHSGNNDFISTKRFDGRKWSQ